MKRFSSLRLSARLRFFVLLGFVAFEASLMIYAWKTAASPTHGFLVKSGQEYVLAWQIQGNSFEVQKYQTLKEAMGFARDTLKLGEGINPTWNDSLEYVSLEERFGSYVLLWKTLRISYLNHLTFDDSTEASFFVAAFRHGHYSPSPFGHSVVLTSFATY